MSSNTNRAAPKTTPLKEFASPTLDDDDVGSKTHERSRTVTPTQFESDHLLSEIGDGNATPSGDAASGERRLPVHNMSGRQLSAFHRMVMVLASNNLNHHSNLSHHSSRDESDVAAAKDEKAGLSAKHAASNGSSSPGFKKPEPPLLGRMTPPSRQHSQQRVFASPAPNRHPARSPSGGGSMPVTPNLASPVSPSAGFPVLQDLTHNIRHLSRDAAIEYAIAATEAFYTLIDGHRSLEDGVEDRAELSQLSELPVESDLDALPIAILTRRHYSPSSGNSRDIAGSHNKSTSSHGGSGDSQGYDRPFISSWSSNPASYYSMVPLQVTNSLNEERGTDGFETLNGYVVLDDLGCGQYGKVKLAADTNHDDRMVAIKCIPRSRIAPKYLEQMAKNRHEEEAETPKSATMEAVDEIDNSPDLSPCKFGREPTEAPSSNEISPLKQALPGIAIADHEQLEEGGDDALTREIAIMKKMNHRHIVRLHEVIDDPRADRVYLVMQHVERGPLLRMNSRNECKPIDLSVAAGYIRQLCSALHYLQKKNVAHRDIKPDNILLGDDGRVYLSDFGVSSWLKEGDGAGTLEGAQGTIAFMPPEVVRGDATHSGYAADVWSLGVTFYTMVFGKQPFRGDTLSALRASIQNDRPEFIFESSMRDDYPLDFRAADSDLDEDEDGTLQDLFISLVQRMLCKDPKERATLPQLSKHPFFEHRGGAAGGSTTSPYNPRRSSDGRNRSSTSTESTVGGISESMDAASASVGGASITRLADSFAKSNFSLSDRPPPPAESPKS